MVRDSCERTQSVLHSTSPNPALFPRTAPGSQYNNRRRTLDSERLHAIPNDRQDIPVRAVPVLPFLPRS